MKELIEANGMSRQNFYQRVSRLNLQKDEIAGILQVVEQIRRDHPRMAIRTIYEKIQPETLGRDKFEQLCSENGLNVKKHRNYRNTTNSKGVVRFPNLIDNIELTGVNQVFVSDITYYEMKGKFYYLTFIMDLFNREIVGYSESSSLRTVNTTIPSLNMLIKNRGMQNLAGSIFHSDGGGQYYSKEFVELTGKMKIINSMTQQEVNENAHAERLNGIIKNNYLYPYNPQNRSQLKKSMHKAVWMYNNQKPHKALKNLTPVEYREIKTIDSENISARYCPLSTAYHYNQKVLN